MTTIYRSGAGAGEILRRYRDALRTWPAPPRLTCRGSSSGGLVRGGVAGSRPVPWTHRPPQLG